MIHVLRRHFIAVWLVAIAVAACSGPTGKTVEGRQYKQSGTWGVADGVMQRGPMLIQIHGRPFADASPDRLHRMVIAAAEQTTKWAPRSRFTTNPERTPDLRVRPETYRVFSKPCVRVSGRRDGRRDAGASQGRLDARTGARTQGSRRASWKGAPAASTPLDDAPASPSARLLAWASFQLVENTRYVSGRTLRAFEVHLSFCVIDVDVPRATRPSWRDRAPVFGMSASRFLLPRRSQAVPCSRSPAGKIADSSQITALGRPGQNGDCRYLFFGFSGWVSTKCQSTIFSFFACSS